LKKQARVSPDYIYTRNDLLKVDVAALEKIPFIHGQGEGDRPRGEDASETDGGGTAVPDEESSGAGGAEGASDRAGEYA
jgi:hypothetical protein